MSQCSIKSRKAKVNLIYENSFDFSFNDPKECIFESARNEIKHMLQQEIEFFLSKLKLKINNIEIPFLSNCEKCQNINETISEPSFPKSKKKPDNDFDEIFHMILNGNSSNLNCNNLHKKNNSNQNANQHNNNNNHHLIVTNQLQGNNSISTSPLQSFNNNSEAFEHNLIDQNTDFHKKEADNIDKFDKNVFDFLKIVDSGPSGANNNNNINNNSLEQNNSLNNLIENCSDGNSLLSEKQGEKKGASLESQKANNLSSNLLEKDCLNKSSTNLKEEGHEDDLSSIHSSHLEPNFLKANITTHNMEGEGASQNSYDNLTVLEEGKFDKEGEFHEKSGYETHYQGGRSQKKMKIGCFMEDNTGEQIDLLICDNFKSRYESSIYPNILKNTSQNFSHTQINLLEKNKSVNNNYKIYLLYGNIAYSMGSYHKAHKFYQTAINTITEENIDNLNSLNFVTFKCLLQNNLARCLINILNVKAAISVLESSVNTLNDKISNLCESVTNSNNHNPSETNQNTNNNNANNKNLT